MLRFASDYGTVVDDLIKCYKYICCDVIKELNK